MDLSQHFQLLKARMTSAELLDLIGDVLYERGDLGEVLEEVQAAHTRNLRAQRETVERQARESAEREMRSGR